MSRRGRGGCGASPDWTAQGELAAKHDSGNTTTFVSYVYDGTNRRVGKKVDGTLVQGFLYRDAIKPVVELDGSGSVVSRFVYGTSSIVPDYVIKGGSTYRIFSDQAGSPRVVVDVSSGSIVERIDYDERGNTLRDTNPGFIPFGFAGGIVDRDTALVRFGVRDYDPSTGRWLRKEPLGFAGSENFYQYANGDPVNFVDPDGRAAAAIAAPEVLEFLAPAAEAAPLLGPVGVAAIGVIAIVGAYEAFCDNAAPPPADFAKNGERYDGPKPRYGHNDMHNPRSPSFVPQKTPVPPDAPKVFESAVPDSPTSPKNWYGLNEDGDLYRYSCSNDECWSNMSAVFTRLQRLAVGPLRRHHVRQERLPPAPTQ